MCSTSIIDLPIEIIEDFIFPLLTDKDIKNCGKTRIKRLKDIVDDYLKNNYCKSVYHRICVFVRETYNNALFNYE